jgi:hypothetical protein
LVIVSLEFDDQFDEISKEIDNVLVEVIIYESSIIEDIYDPVYLIEKKDIISVIALLSMINII